MIIVEIAGYLGSDAEERFTPNGKKVITLRIAARVRQGGRDETVWWKVSIWGDRFDKMLPYLKKGSAVIVIGEMSKPEIYVGKDGSSQVSLTLNAEIIKFSPFGRQEKSQENSGGGSHSVGEPAYAHAGAAQEQYGSFGASLDSDSSFSGDDLPF